MSPKGTMVARPGSGNLLLLVAAGAAIVTTPAEQFWWLGPFVAGVAACLVLWFNLGQHKVRERRMRTPFRLDLVAVVDTAETFVKELHAPPDSEFSVQIRIWPHLKYTQHELIFGFMGHASGRPIPKKVLNEFIKIGSRREQSPATNPMHSIDRNDHYHITEDRNLTPPNNYTYGFVIQTREPGVYPIRFEVITDCGEGHSTNGIFLTVDPRPQSNKSP